MDQSSTDYLNALIDSLHDSPLKSCLESFYFDCKVKNLAPKTIDVYGERLRNFHRFLESKGIEFEKVDPASIQSYILSMKGRVSDYTVNGRIRVLRLFFNYLHREALWDNGNPMGRIKLVRAERRFPRIIPMRSFNNARSAERIIYELVAYVLNQHQDMPNLQFTQSARQYAPQTFLLSFLTNLRMRVRLSMKKPDLARIDKGGEENK